MPDPPQTRPIFSAAVEGAAARLRLMGAGRFLHKLDEFLAGVDAELAVHVAQMGAHGVLGDAEKVGHIGGAMAAGDVGQDLALAGTSISCMSAERTRMASASSMFSMTS